MIQHSVTKRELWGWCLYDFANSSFTTLIITVAYSVYFVQIVAGHLEPAGSAERLWFWGYAISMLLVAVLSPTLGAVADVWANKRVFLIGSTLVCIVCTGLLYFVQSGDIWLGLILFGLANVAFELGFMFCSAFLVELTSRESMGRLSGYGWGLGYAGGLLSLALAYPFLVGGFVEQNLPWYRLSFVVTAIFFLVFSIPTLLYLRERAVAQVLVAGLNVWRQGFERLRKTVHEIRRFRDLAVYFLGYLIYTDAINTVIVAASIFANKVLDFSPKDLIIYFLVMQIAAGAGAVGTGVLADRLGPKRVISMTLVIWIGIAIGAALVQTHLQFYVIGLLAGSVLGANQSVSRALLGLMTPQGRQGEFFGFFSVTGKFAAIFGPILYGEVTVWSGSQRWAVLTMAVLFGLGLFVLRFVDEQRGMTMAQTSA